MRYGTPDYFARQREAKRLQRHREWLRFELLIAGVATFVAVGILLAGFFVAPWGGGWFAIALCAWIAGGAYTLAFGIWLINVAVRLRRLSRR